MNRLHVFNRLRVDVDAHHGSSGRPAEHARAGGLGGQSSTTNDACALSDALLPWSRFFHRTRNLKSKILKRAVA